jgi:hypothetical protein
MTAPNIDHNTFMPMQQVELGGTPNNNKWQGVTTSSIIAFIMACLHLQAIIPNAGNFMFPMTGRTYPNPPRLFLIDDAQLLTHLSWHWRETS